MKTIYERFISKVDKKSVDECWTWRGATYRKGYGHLRRWADGKWVMEKAHRFAYEHYNGVSRESIKGLMVCHTCDNPACVNPKHLFIGTALDNNQDKMRKGRVGFGRNTSHNWLSYEIAEKIRALKIKNPNLTYKQIGILFNTSTTQVHRIINNQIWNRKVGT
jgi:hypothetical protein